MTSKWIRITCHLLRIVSCRTFPWLFVVKVLGKGKDWSSIVLNRWAFTYNLSNMAITHCIFYVNFLIWFGRKKLLTRPRLQKRRLSMKKLWSLTTRSRWTCASAFSSKNYSLLLISLAWLYFTLMQESTADDGDEESDRSKSEVNDQDEESAEVMKIIFCWIDMKSFMVLQMLG